jgi:NADH-quinone oxidoreductase subunit F
MPALKRVADLTALSTRLEGRKPAGGTVVTMCGGTGCQASGCGAVLDAFKEALSRQGRTDDVELRVTGCHGFCEQGPLMIIEPGNVLYCRIRPEDVPEIVAETIASGALVERLLYTDPVSGRKVVRMRDVPFYQVQDRLLLGQNERVRPTEIEDYIAIGGYAALGKVLSSMTAEEVIEEIRASGLRGRGGGGFPTARKWESCRRATGSPKIVICNADEGDPGAFMNRSVLEGNPHAVIEGMLIGAYAIGATRGFVYVRTEYPLALKHTRLAIEQARAYGLLGENILGSGLSFDIEVARGAGAFVAGESTALMAALEGKVSEPRPKDVHTVEKGYKDLPSNLNNVETWADVPLIIRNGSAWFARKGTAKSAGTKIFALTGQINNTGLVEVELGKPLRTILYDIGGGGVNGNTIKAVQIGGPSGGCICIPETLFDLTVDFEGISEAGAMVGSGGIVVMDNRTCMVDVAKFFLTFLRDESCGKCVPCRVGIKRMLEIVTDITEGRGRPEQIPLLQELGETVAETSLCALGKTAPNPVLSTLRYFREEYEAHIRDGRCPAGVCRALIRYEIDPERCTGCGACLRACPHGAVSGEKKQPHVIDPDRCTRCGICRDECKLKAVQVA